MPKIEKSEREWREQLTPEQYEVTREGGTERAFTGPYVDEKSRGMYRCVGCGTCVVQAPKVFRLDARGKAEVTTPVQTWSPLQGSYVLNCQTSAISVRPEGTAA